MDPTVGWKNLSIHLFEANLDEVHAFIHFEIEVSDYFERYLVVGAWLDLESIDRRANERPPRPAPVGEMTDITAAAWNDVAEQRQEPCPDGFVTDRQLDVFEGQTEALWPR